MAFKVSRDDPDLAAALQPDLGGSEDVAGRVQRKPDAVHVERHAVSQLLDPGIGAEAGLEQNSARWCREIAPTPGSRVVRVGVSDDRPADRSRGVNVEIGSRTVQTVFSILDHGFFLLETGHYARRQSFLFPLWKRGVEGF
jgi:hypothetical protein